MEKKMKIYGNVQIYGIERIIFDRVTEYTLRDKTEKFDGVWERSKSPRNKETDRGLISNQQMAKNITCICNTREYNVGFNGNTVHVDTRSKEVSQPPTVIFIDCNCVRHRD